MLEHPQGHLVGDHVALFGYFFVVLEAAGDDFNEIGLEDRGKGSPLLGKRSHAAWM